MIYIDLLVVEELIINYCLLISTSLILNRITKIKKIYLSSVVGLVPLIFFFLSTNKLLLNTISFVFIIVMSIISFGYKDIVYTFRNVIYIYFMSIFLAGGIYLINVNFLPEISSHVLNFIFLCTVSPIITMLYIKSLKKIKITYSNYYILDIYLKDKSKITIKSFLDTGNILKDPYTRKPIILVNKNKINYQNEKLFLVPYNTIDSHGLLNCFKPEKIYIHDIGYRKKVLIGLIDDLEVEDAESILNKEVLERI